MSLGGQPRIRDRELIATHQIGVSTVLSIMPLLTAWSSHEKVASSPDRFECNGWGWQFSTVAGCGTPAQSGRIDASESALSTTKPGSAADPGYPGVNTVGHDRDVWQQLLSDHKSIRRSLIHKQEGELGIVEATTESDDPVVAKRIISHATAMQARMKTGAQVRVWDEVFKDLFAVHDRVTLEVTPTEKGVKIVESSRDPQTIALLRAHAMGVNSFVRGGQPASARPTDRVSVGTGLPPNEVAIGGVPHRFLLGTPDAAQIAAMKAQGIQMIINFRKPAEHAEYDELSAAKDASIEYCNLPYKEAVELTDQILDQARVAIRESDKKGAAIAMHCRTGNRVGPAWAAYRAIDMGIPVEQAIAEAKAIRMTDARLEAVARDYINRHQPKVGSAQPQ